MRTSGVTPAGSGREVSRDTLLAADEHVMLDASWDEARVQAYFAQGVAEFATTKDDGENGDERPE